MPLPGPKLKGLRLTTEMVRLAYEFLCETPPFNKWNLPDSDDIKFIIHKSRDYGAFQVLGPDMFMYVSESNISHILPLFETVAHEMIHLHQHRTGLEIDHGPAFQKWAQLVCRHHREFDPRDFY